MEHICQQVGTKENENILSPLEKGGHLYSPLKKGDKGGSMKIHYNPKLKTIARKLRKQGVLSEVLLWDHIKGKKMNGYQFMRQKPVGEYIVDFYCSKLKLVVEIDG